MSGRTTPDPKPARVGERWEACQPRSAGRGVLQRLLGVIRAWFDRRPPAAVPSLGPVLVEVPHGVRLHLLADFAEQANCALVPGTEPRTLRLVPLAASREQRHSTAPELAPWHLE